MDSILVSMLLKRVLMLTLLEILSTVNGMEPIRAENKQFPFSALISVNETHYCSGVLLSNRFVLTLKVCVIDAEKLQIKLGPVRNGQRTDYTYDHIIPTRSFYSTQYVVNRNEDEALALIYLEPKCNFTHDIQPILYTGTSNLSYWYSASGYFNTDGLDVVDLRTTEMELVQDDACKELYPNIDIEALICARGILGGNFCLSSAGSALIDEKRTLVGLAFFHDNSIRDGVKVCERSVILARVSFFSAWIHDILERTP